MTTSRRDFIRTSVGAGFAAGLGAGTLAASPALGALRRSAPKTLLILGGTNFIGPHMIDAAKALGYEVTIFNRGITEERKQTPITGVEKIVGDRDPDKGDGLKNLEAHIKDKGGWDAVIDTSGFVPRIVKASAELLMPAVKQYLFISTLSVYADNSQADNDEDSPLATMEDPTDENVQQHYGALKALCEGAVLAADASKTCNVRPGFIVGPGDGSDRFTYWPVRIDKGGDVLVPGTPDDPVQFIDVRDLADFCMRLIESRTMGAFNATGPVGGCTVGRLVKACQGASGKPSNPVYVDAEFLASKGIENVTILIPPRGEAAGFHKRSLDKSAKAGLKSRTVEDTVKTTLAWWPAEVERRKRVTKDLIEQAAKDGKPAPQLPDPEKLRAGLSPEQETELLTAYKEHLAPGKDGAETGNDKK